MKTKKVVGIVLSSLFATLSVGIAVAGSIIASKYDGVLTPLFGTSRRNMTKVNYDGIEPWYYKNTYTEAELKKETEKLADAIAEEGIVLLERGNIPYNSTNTKLSLFSKSSVDFVFGGTGSGTAYGNLTLKTALENSGYQVNDALWNFYKSGEGSKFSRGAGSINYGDKDDFSINEVPLPLIKAKSELTNSFSEYKTGVFVLSRTGGEGNDLARGMSPYVDTDLDLSKGYHKDIEGDKYRSYLEPDSIELEIMQYINDNFDDFILIVNCNNAVELGFKDQFDKLKTIIQVPATGESGLNALGKILKGEVASSGHLADTFVKDAFNIPSSQNIGDFEYLVNGQRMPNIANMGSNFDGLFYMNYDEGIYVGYRYFETRYEDYIKNRFNASAHGFKYEENVIYPFGYGDSIASFSYGNMTIENISNGYKIGVTVTNNSDIAAKDAVELYVSAPYGEYERTHHVERSSIELLDFEKTPLIEPHQSQTLSFTVTKDDLKNYQEEGAGQYYLAQGDYYFTFGMDAHAAMNNVLRAEGYIDGLVASPSESLAGDASLVKKVTLLSDLETFKVDQVTGTTVKNQFAFANANTYDLNHKYLSRSDWDATYPTIQGNISNIISIHSERTTTAPDGSVGSHEYVKELDTNSKIYKDVVEFATHTPDLDTSGEIKWGQPTNLDWIDLRGLDFDDPRYDEVADKITLDQAVELFSNGGYQTASATSINKPMSVDYDGPAGLNTVSGHSSIGFSYPCSLIIGQTWNKELMHRMGELIGMESLNVDVNGWYAPTANIHRSPFGGRNFEYFSEDPVLAGEGAKQELNGAAQYGLFGYLKHFALNDQETHREKENGICIFANEQTMRTLYFKAFERAIKNNTVNSFYYELQRNENKEVLKDENGQPKFIRKEVALPACTAVMSSFSRLGGCWAGACYPLLDTVLQEEWGFHGVILTDYYHNWFMSKGQSLAGGGTCMLDPQGNKFTVDSNDQFLQYMLKKAVKNTMYGTVNSNTANGYVNGVKEIPMWKNYVTIIIIVDVVLGLTAIILGLNVARIATGFKFKRKNKEEDLEIEEQGQ